MKVASWIFSIVTFFYVAIRVFTVDMTFDEGWTYFEYVQYPVHLIVSGYSPRANNHILNTLLTKFCCLFSTHQFAVRLPNLLALILYLYTSNKIGGLLFKKPTLQVSTLICLVANYILLEFFGLCRGYGLAISLMLFSVYKLMQFGNNPTRRSLLHISLIFAIMSTYANFSLLDATLGIFLITVWIGFAHAKGTMLYRLGNSIKVPFVYGIVLAGLCAYPILRLIRANELYYGGENNFISDTLSTMLIEYVGHQLFNSNQVLALVITLSIILIAVFYTIARLRHKFNLVPIQLYSITIFLVAVILINIQFYVFGSKLPISRTALYLFPLLILSIFSVIVNRQHKVD